MKLDMLRHGETTRGGGFRGSLDDELTEQGWQQMWQAVAEVRGWQRIVCSPLQRCAHFARALAQRLALPLEPIEGWRELDFGEWEGRLASELMETQAEALGRFWDDPYGFTPPGGEPVADFEQRVLAALESLQRRAADEQVLMVGHAGVMRLLQARALGLPRAQLLQVSVAHGQLLRLDVSRTQQGVLQLQVDTR